jgi:hypothetical protein
MARAARKPKDNDGGEVKAKDAALAKKLYFHDIKPARSKASEFMQEVSTGKKAVKKQAHFQSTSFDTATRWHELEDAKKEDAVRGFVMLFNELEGREVLTCHFGDMVDQMQGDDGYARPKISLVTLGEPSDGTETDLCDAAFEEATDEELAQQDGRNSPAD